MRSRIVADRFGEDAGEGDEQLAVELRAGFELGQRGLDGDRVRAAVGCVAERDGAFGDGVGRVAPLRRPARPGAGAARGSSGPGRSSARACR